MLGAPSCSDPGPRALRQLNDRLPFHNLYRHGFARVAMAVPRCRVADPAFNAAETIALLHDAARAGAVLVGFPELGLSAYTCDDLFHQRSLLDACVDALATVVQASKGCAAAAGGCTHSMPTR